MKGRGRGLMDSKECMQARLRDGIIAERRGMPDTLEAHRAISAAARYARKRGVRLDTLVAGVREEGDGFRMFVATRDHVFGEGAGREPADLSGEEGIRVYGGGESERTYMLNIYGRRMTEC